MRLVSSQATPLCGCSADRAIEMMREAGRLKSNMTSEQAILAVRHVVQDHGDEGTTLGRSALCEGVRWFGGLLGWSWPPTYLEVIGKHDGVMVQDAWVFGFLESVERFLLLHEAWHKPDG